MPWRARIQIHQLQGNGLSNRLMLFFPIPENMQNWLQYHWTIPRSISHRGIRIQACRTLRSPPRRRKCNSSNRKLPGAPRVSTDPMKKNPAYRGSFFSYQWVFIFQRHVGTTGLGYTRPPTMFSRSRSGGSKAHAAGNPPI